MPPLLTDDDRPPAPAPRRVNRGLLAAAALAVVVLGIATVVAFTSDDGGTSRGPVIELDPDDPQAMFPGALEGGRDVSGEQVGAITFDGFGAEGEGGSFGDYGGRPLVVNFFASWCTPCIEEMPEFEAVHQQLGGDVAFLGLNYWDRDQATAQRLVERTGVTYDLGRDAQGEILQELGGYGMPTTVFVDSSGVVRSVHTGKLDAAGLSRIIDEQLRA
jgi:cytochrome c biogenesis protein CcmG, thiol:disulfide interchange protein DsbE